MLQALKKFNCVIKNNSMKITRQKNTFSEKFSCSEKVKSREEKS